MTVDTKLDKDETTVIETTNGNLIEGEKPPDENVDRQDPESIPIDQIKGAEELFAGLADGFSKLLLAKR